MLYNLSVTSMPSMLKGASNTSFLVHFSANFNICFF